MRLLSCVLAAAVAAGCGAGRSPVRPSSQAIRPPAAPPQESLSAYIEKTREVSARAAASPPRALGTTLESIDPELGAALVSAQVSGTGAAARRVAAAYERHGIFDMAHQYLTAAVKADPRDAANYEALARLWRDVRMAHLGLSDAHRAVYFAPGWAAAHNTLGTVFQALGRRKEARAEYERALALDPTAAYALNNLCYSDILDGRTASAIARCTGALRQDAGLRAAQNNLGLAYAAAGRMSAALDAFNLAVDPAGALYNLGMVRLARGENGSAVEAFQAAQARKGSFPLAAVRADQARAQLGSGDTR